MAKKKTGSQIAQMLPARHGAKRDKMLVDLVREGNAICHLFDINVGGRLTISCMADALLWGTAEDCIRFGLSPSAQVAALAELDLMPLTPLMADKLWEASARRAEPHTQKVTTSTKAFILHSAQLDADVEAYGRPIHNWKDWCLTKASVETPHTTNYGWHIDTSSNEWRKIKLNDSVDGDHKVIEPAHTAAHATGDFAKGVPGHCDYSELVCGMGRKSGLDGEVVLTEDILAGKYGEDAARLISHEGVLFASTPPAKQPKQSKPRRTTKGDSGAAVRQWQEWLLSQDPKALPRYGSDGDHGSETESWSVKIDGAVKGPSGPKEEASTEIKFRQAKHFRPGRRAEVLWVGIHVAQMNEDLAGADENAEALMNYGTTMPDTRPPASWHYAVDSDSETQSVLEKDTAFHAGGGGANDRSIGVELSGWTEQTCAEWGDEYSTKVLRRAATLVAGICQRHNIPIRKVGPSQIVAGAKGICGHNDFRLAFGKTTHTDPGENFPWRLFVKMVEENSGS